MTACDVCLLGADDVYNQFYRESVHVARKAHQCCECERGIPVGARYQRAVGKSDGEVWTRRTCLICLEVRTVFYCDGNGPTCWLFGELWDDMEVQAFDRLTTASPCFRELSPAAKAYVLERWNRWKGLARPPGPGGGAVTDVDPARLTDEAVARWIATVEMMRRIAGAPVVALPTETLLSLLAEVRAGRDERMWKGLGLPQPADALLLLPRAPGWGGDDRPGRGGEDAVSEQRIAEIHQRLDAMLAEEEALMDEARDLGDPTFAPLTPEEQERIATRTRHVIDAVVLREENARLRADIEAHGGRRCDVAACNCDRPHWPACSQRAGELARYRDALTADDVVEECARTLYESDGWEPATWPARREVLKDEYRSAARAVLAVLRRRDER